MPLNYPTIKQPKAITQEIDDFSGGYNSYEEVTDTPLNSVVEASNVMLEQNGKWRPRYGTKAYGATLTGPITGAPNPGVEVMYNGTRYVCVIDNGAFKYSTDGGSWTTVSGATFDTTVWTEMVQLRDRLYLCNSADDMAFVALSSFTMNTYTAETVPSGVTPTKTGLAGTTYTYYYVVSAVNTVGETTGSTQASVTVGKERDNWGASDYVDVSWTGSSDQYNVYVGTQTGYLYYLTTVNGTSFKDDGAKAFNDLIESPVDDTTTGPKLTGISVIDNRIWGIAADGAVYFSGQGSQVGAFSPFYGGGYTYVNKGSGEETKKTIGYRDGRGNPLPTVLTSTSFGAGSTWHVQITTATIGETLITIPALYRATGSVGTNSPRGVIEARNSIFYPSTKGWQVLGSKPNLLNVLSADEVSRNIRPDVRNLQQDALSGVAGAFYDNMLLWSVPNGSTNNNETWGMSFFTDRKGNEKIAWMGRWTIGVKHFFEYTDSDGQSRLLAVPVTGTKLIEFTRSVSCYDSGVAFSTRIRSGLIHWDDTHLSWARPEYGFIEASNPKGTITFKIAGTQKNKSYALLKSATVQDAQSNVGFSTYLFSAKFFSDTSQAPSTYATSSTKKRTKRIGKLLNNWSWEVSSSSGDTDYVLTRVIMKDAYPEETTDPSSWRS